MATSMDLGAADVHTSGHAALGPQQAPPSSAQAPKAKGKKTKGTKGARRGLRMTIDHPQHGRFEIRHMTDGTKVELAHAPPVLLARGDDAPRVWIQLAKSGDFSGHPAGRFSLNAKVFANIIRNFKAGQQPIPIDAEHASEQSPTSGNIPSQGAPAMGWIHDLQVRGADLWASVEWLEPAKTYIKEGRYRYISPAIAFKARDQVTGEEIGPLLSSAGITNTPFLSGMAPLVAARRDGSGSAEMSARCFSAHEYMPQIRAALAAHPLATMSDLRGHLDGLREMLDRAGGDHTATVDGVKLSDHIGPLRTMANVPITCTTTELLDIVEALIADAIEDHEEEFHEDEDGDAAMSASLSAGGASTETIPTTPAPVAEEPPMAAVNEEITALSSKLSAVEAENVSLKAARAKGLEAEATAVNLTNKVAELEAASAALKAENKALREAQEKRDAADIERDVDDAIADHGGKNPVLCKDNRDVLIAMRRATPDAFRKIAPKLNAEQRALMTRRVPEREHVEASSLPHGQAKIATAVELAHKLIKDEPGKYGKLDFEDVKEAAAVMLSNNPLGIAL